MKRVEEGGVCFFYAAVWSLADDLFAKKMRKMLVILMLAEMLMLIEVMGIARGDMKAQPQEPELTNRCFEYVRVVLDVPFLQDRSAKKQRD